MSNHRKPRLPDPAATAFAIMQRIAGETKPVVEPVVAEKKLKAGKLGGAKGVAARTAKSAPARRKAIAKKSAS